jgi:RNA recognition motif-containing protein
MDITEDEEINELKVYVGNLPFSVTNEELVQLFSPFGTIQGVNIRRNRDTNTPRGFGFITFSSADEAREAIRSLSGYSLQGRVLTINSADTRGKKKEDGERRAKVDNSWKTVPTPRKGSKSTNTQNRKTWDEWAGPQIKK